MAGELVASEHEEQAAFFEWALYHRELDCMFAIPNGGKRSKAVAGKLKAEGVKPGVPDIFLPLPSQRYHGLFIEMKRRKRARVSDPQTAFGLNLIAAGYKVVVAAGWEEAVRAVTEYLGLGGRKR